MSIFTRFHKKQETVPLEKTALPSVAVTSIPAVPISVRGNAKQTRAWSVLQKPLVSEKAADVGAMNQYVFVVANTATKVDVRNAIRDTYGISPMRVTMVRVRGKTVRSGRTVGVTKAWKKAYVTLPKGKKIQIYEGV